MRLVAGIFCALCLLASPALAQSPAPDDPPAWEFAVAGATYFVPDDSNYLQPTMAADRDWLHLETRYNYEASDTASAWLGYNFSGGERWAWELTPMIGGVFGDTSGIAPGYKGSLSWRKIEFSSEGELLFDTGESSDSFFYNWSSSRWRRSSRSGSAWSRNGPAPIKPIATSNAACSPAVHSGN